MRSFGRRLRLIDLNNDGALDVVVGTGFYFLGPAANKIMAIDGKTGAAALGSGDGWAGPRIAGRRPGRRAALCGSSAAAGRSCPGTVPANCNGNSASWTAPCAPGRDVRRCVKPVADINNEEHARRRRPGRADAGLRPDHRRMETTARSQYPRDFFSSYATPTIAKVNGKTWIVQVNIGDQNRNRQTDGGDDLVVSIWTTGPHSVRPRGRRSRANMARTGWTAAPVRTTVDPFAHPGTGVLHRRRLRPATGRHQPHPGRGQQQRLRLAGLVRQSATRLLPPTSTTAPTPSTPTSPSLRSARRQVCYVNSPLASVHLVADHLGTIRGNAYVPPRQRCARPQGRHPHRPRRRTHPAIGSRVLHRRRLSPATRPSSTSPRRGRYDGYGLLVSRQASHAALLPPTSTTAPAPSIRNIADRPDRPDGQVCFVNSTLASIHLVADHLGARSRRNAYIPALAERCPAPQGRHPHRPRRRTHPHHRVASASPSPARPADASRRQPHPGRGRTTGYGLLAPQAVGNPLFASNVNYGPSTIDPNVAIAPIGARRTGLLVNSLLRLGPPRSADHLGTIPPQRLRPRPRQRSPDRKVDTRIGWTRA